MVIASPTFKADNISVDIINAENVLITNLSIPSTGTEYSHALQSGLKQITVRSRVLATVQIAFVSTESGTKYLTLKPGTVLHLSDIDFTSQTIYLQSDTITTMEIMELYT